MFLKLNKGPLVTSDSADALSRVSESSVWLANFTSDRTRYTYKMTVSHFAAAMGFSSEDDWCRVKPSHVIAWRELMKESGQSDRTIQTRLSALSSLFKHLCDKQIVGSNPVQAVKRPQVNSDQVKSVALKNRLASCLMHRQGTSQLASGIELF